MPQEYRRLAAECLRIAEALLILSRKSIFRYCARFLRLPTMHLFADNS